MLIIENMSEQIKIRPELKKVEKQYLKLIELEKSLETIAVISWDECSACPHLGYDDLTWKEIIEKNHAIISKDIFHLVYSIDYNRKNWLKKLLELNNPRNCVNNQVIEDVFWDIYNLIKNIISHDKRVVDRCSEIISANFNEPYIGTLEKIVESYEHIYKIMMECFDVVNEMAEILGVNKQDFQNIVSEINCFLGRIIKKIFIIHGRCNNENNDLKDYLLSEFKLESTIMIPASDKGSKTIIEKFEELASECDLAIAILTPDDLVSRNKDSYSQPRPNVFFEIGWFFGKIGRDKVKIFMRKDTTFDECTDLQGVIAPRFSEIEECYQSVKQFLEENGKIIVNGH